IAARQVLRSQRIVRYFDARFHRRDAIVDNSSNRHAPKPHPDHFAHTDWRVGDARAQPNPEKIEKNDREDETENSEHREADESKRKLHGETVAASLCEAQRRVCRHPASRRPEGDMVAAFRCNPRETEYALRVVTRTKVAVVGASGYTGEELVRLLLAHPHVDLVAATSRQLAGKALSQVCPRFSRRTIAAALKFSG